MNRLDEYRAATREMGPETLLRWAADAFGPRSVAFASSLGAEDQVIAHMIATGALPIPAFTLDTGRLFQESYDLIERTRDALGLVIAPYVPDAHEVEEMVRDAGVNLFYRSVEDRKRCCGVRKVAPLARALAGRVAWITGLRQEQAPTRSDVRAVGWDEANGLYRIAPLWDWTEAQVWAYVREHEVPYHVLHDRGFRSIGCAPCTRAVKPGEDARSGRWWWEHPDQKECGLHAGRRAAGRGPAGWPEGDGSRNPTTDGPSGLPFGIRPVSRESTSLAPGRAAGSSTSEAADPPDASAGSD